jgi:long-chain acyl-CoA synthetase
MLVPDQLRRAARLYGDATAIICGDEARTYAQVDARTDRLARALLDRGLVLGDRVVTWIENSIACIELDFALAKAGLVRVALNPRLTPREARFIVEDSDAKALFHGASFDDRIEGVVENLSAPPLRIRVAEGMGRSPDIDYEDFLAGAPPDLPQLRCDPEELYCLFYTSGTTGNPKGVMLSHRAILHVAYNLLMETGPLQQGEKILLMQPLSHGAGFYVLPYYMKGGTSIVMRHFDADEVLRLAALHGVETIKLIPTMLQRILRVSGVEEVRLPKLRSMIYGASAMPEQPLRRAIEIFGPGKLVQIYGQSECPMALTILPGEEHRLDNPDPARLTSAGRPWSTVEIRVVDSEGGDVPTGASGEVILRGPHLMSGYWKREDLSRQAVRDGWLHTNDLGRFDASGLLYLLGRKDEMIISGGYNIAPREVEDVLYRSVAVHEAAVLGEPDAEWGHAVVAYVCMKGGEENMGALVDFARGELGFKCPKRFYVMGELPKNAAGKIQKKALTPQMASACVSSARKAN